jgi:hypothetical protein
MSEGKSCRIHESFLRTLGSLPRTSPSELSTVNRFSSSLFLCCTYTMSDYGQSVVDLDSHEYILNKSWAEKA